MSVIVKGMEMPKSCGDCLLRMGMEMAWEFWCGVDNRSIENIRERPEDCPLVILPKKHGDLIDRDALVPDICHDWNGFSVPDDDYSARCIKNAPTVIGAEGKNT